MIHRTKLAGSKSRSASGVLLDHRIAIQLKGKFIKYSNFCNCVEQNVGQLRNMFRKLSVVL